MRTFAPKQSRSQEPVSSSLDRREQPSRKLPHELPPTASPRFEHDFSRIPIYPSVAGATQTKLPINTPGDEHEQEADRIAAQVTGKPGPSQETQHVQPTHTQPGELSRTMAPPVVHETLAGTGQPLDPATRGFFEPRFGHDFSKVRVHTDARAAQSAMAVDASAYTVGQHVVF